MNVEMRFLSETDAIRQAVNRAMGQAHQSVLICTALVRQLRLELLDEVVPFARVADELLGRGVSVFLLLAGTPSRPFLESLRQHPRVLEGMPWRLCARVHFKAVLVDPQLESRMVVFGSSNLTGGGLGVRPQGRQNFEFAISTNDGRIINRISQVAWDIWQGRPCERCRMQKLCRRENERMARALEGEGEGNAAGISV